MPGSKFRSIEPLKAPDSSMFSLQKLHVFPLKTSKGYLQRFYCSWSNMFYTLDSHFLSKWKWKNIINFLVNITFRILSKISLSNMWIIFKTWIIHQTTLLKPENYINCHKNFIEMSSMQNIPFLRNTISKKRVHEPENSML